MRTLVEDLRSQIDALFAQALERPAAERSAYVKKACKGDGRLLAPVHELLRFADEPVAGLDRGPGRSGALLRELADELVRRPDATAVGDRIGPWRLVRELGRGGMGTVYLAERTDGEFQRTVALKLLHAGFGSEDTLLRFEQERQILASLEHPNIARMIDGGRTDDGRPYLTMEHVVGRRIDSYCEQERLGLDARLDLLIGIANAVQSAHRRLVVHRDLKPSNILVTDDGIPKLLDFGIAKLLQPASEGEPLTRTLTRVLTPEYASPEQVRGDLITTASDVYQLGLLLFELLTGERAQRIEGAATPSEIERMVCDEETPKPSTVVARAVAEARTPTLAISARLLRGDLDNIVLRALHKEPDRRYGSAAELVADLERFRRGFPIEARPDTLRYRASRFVKRHSVGVAATALVAVLLVGYALTVTLQQRRIRAEAERARQATAFVTQMFRSSEGGKLKSGKTSALDVIDRGAQLATSALANQPDLQAEILTGFGEVYMEIGHYDRAIPSLESALDLRSRHLPASDPRTARTAMLLGMNLHYSGRLHEAEPPLRQARSSYLQAYGSGHASACLALTHLGDLLHTRGDLPAAESELRTAHQECGGALALRDLANVLRDRGDLETALAAYPEALEQFERENTRQAGITYQYWGYALTLDGDLEKAARAFERSVEINASEFGADHPVFGTGLRYRGRLALARGDTAESDRLAEQSLAMHRRWLGDGHHLVQRAIVDRASVALARGQPVMASEIAREAISRYEELRIPNHPMALEARQIVGAALLATGEPGAAIPRFRDVIARQEALFVPDDARLGASYALLAEALDRTGELLEANDQRERARAIFALRPMSAILYCRTYGAPLLEVADSCRF